MMLVARVLAMELEKLTGWRCIGDVELRGLDALTEEVKIVSGLKNDPQVSGLNNCVPITETKACVQW